MIWEELKVYKPLSKDDLAFAKKELNQIIVSNLTVFGFKKYGNKLIRQSNDLLHLIFLDNRGSWIGQPNSLKIEIAIVSIYDTEIIVDNFEPISGIFLPDIIPGIKNYYQITSEYKLFADFILRKLIEKVIPFFERYKSSKAVIENPIQLSSFMNGKKNFFKANDNLILYSLLCNQITFKTEDGIQSKIDFLSRFENLSERKLFFYEDLKKNLEMHNWKNIENALELEKTKVCKKLKIDSASC